jgi:predicted acetyltransferase
MTLPQIAIRTLTAEDRPALSRMLELYQYELSDIWDQDLDAQGIYGYNIDRFGHTPEAHAYIASVNGCYAGFALVDRAVKVGTQGWWMDQLFVMKKVRRHGVGIALAQHAFQSQRGEWEVGQMRQNTAARTFWRAVIAQYTAGHFTEHDITEGWWQGTVQCFRSV